MKTGRNLVELAQELTRRAESKQDYLAPTKELWFDADQKLTIGALEPVGVTDHTHRQMGTWAGVPAKYYDRLRDTAPDLLQVNMNHWFRNSSARRMVRTLDGNARAFLSDRYRRIDNEDIAEQVLPVLLDSGNFAEVISTEVTERKLYIKAIFPKIEGEVGVGDVVQAGVIVSNSEIGLGSLDISPFIYRLICLNGMKSNDYGLNRYHVGRKVKGDGDNAHALFRDDTLHADDEALMLKVRDIVTSAASGEVFNKLVERMKATKEGATLENPVAAVEVLSKNYGFNEGEKVTVLENLMSERDYSRYGVLNAITATANTRESYDRASEFEELGGKIIDLKPNEWKVIAEAA